MMTMQSILNRCTRTVAPIAIAAMLLGSTTGCAGAKVMDGPRTVVMFTNNALGQADVYVVGTSSFRIGTVMPGRTASLEVPESIMSASTIRIVAQILAQPTAVSSGPLVLNRGDRLNVTLPLSANMLTVLPGG